MWRDPRHTATLHFSLFTLHCNATAASYRANGTFENGAECPFLPPEGVLPVHRMAEKRASIRTDAPGWGIGSWMTKIFNKT